MNSTICSNAEEGTTGQLTDLRDGKTYWVTKLKDNNCWMTQNLALDLSTEKPLTSELSDVSTEGYTPPADTQVGTITTFPSSSDRTFSFDPGEYVYTTPTTRNSCGTTGIKGLSQCTSKGWQLVTGLGKDTTGNEQAHYLAGNYYSYFIATAGYASDSGDAPNSICPKGWTLPTGGSSGRQYNDLVSGLTVTQITASPYYFVYGGYVDSSSLYAAGSNGYYWSSTANISTYAYLLVFTTSVDPSFNNVRYIGLSVRCVAR